MAPQAAFIDGFLDALRVSKTPAATGQSDLILHRPSPKFSPNDSGNEMNRVWLEALPWSGLRMRGRVCWR